MIYQGRLPGVKVRDGTKAYPESQGHLEFSPELQDEHTHNLTDHIDSVCWLIRTSDLHTVILVGHSYSGMVTRGAKRKLAAQGWGAFLELPTSHVPMATMPQRFYRLTEAFAHACAMRLLRGDPQFSWFFSGFSARSSYRNPFTRVRNAPYVPVTAISEGARSAAGSGQDLVDLALLRRERHF